MMRHPVRNAAVAVIAVGAVFGLSTLAGVFRDTHVAPDVDQELSLERLTELAPKGRELVMAGDCFGCHSLPDGPMGAGGFPIATPFGTVFSTNITPDKTYGIGTYSRADFHRALRDGIGKDKGNLYPAMPFVFTHITRPDDIDAIYAYMMSIPPIPVANRDNTGAFGLPVRPFMNFWTLLNFPDRDAPDNPDRSAAWNRGAYLVEGLAHCGACHSPRDTMMGVEFDHALQGGSQDGLIIPDITAETLAARGYDVAILGQYLATGVAPQGTSFAGMHTVTHFSTSAMTPDDVNAVATYLLTDAQGNLPAPKAPPVPMTDQMDDAVMQSGRLSYISSCSGCHGIDGGGIPNVAPAMYGNAILAMDSPVDTISVVLNGIPTQTFGNGQRMYAMPPFSHRLSDAEIAEMVTWIRAEWGGRVDAVTTEQVASQETAVE